jgi:hypothetical protein
VELLFDRVAGLDIGKATLTVCVRTPGPNGRRVSEVRTYPTMTRSLQAMRSWLLEHGVTIAAMESTSTYWKAPFYCLEAFMKVWLLNAAHMKAVPGRKTDVRDAEWIAQLLEHGLLRPSFVPPADIRRLRMLTRYREQLMGDRTREAMRLELMLEDASIKLSVVASSLTTVSARAMLGALIDGERDPRALAELAKGRMRVKIPALTEALTGHFDAGHARLARSTITRAVGEVRPLLAERGCTVGGGLRLRTLADVVAHPGARGQVGLLDATEVRVRRPAAGRAGRRRFVSGKARANTVKALVITDAGGRLLFCGQSRPGSIHDLTQVRQAGLVELLALTPAPPRWPTPAIRARARKAPARSDGLSSSQLREGAGAGRSSRPSAGRRGSGTGPR